MGAIAGWIGGPAAGEAAIAPMRETLLEHLAGKRNHEEILWTFLNLEIWHRTLRPA